MGPRRATSPCRGPGGRRSSCGLSLLFRTPGSAAGGILGRREGALLSMGPGRGGGTGCPAAGHGKWNSLPGKLTKGHPMRPPLYLDILLLRSRREQTEIRSLHRDRSWKFTASLMMVKDGGGGHPPAGQAHCGGAHPGQSHDGSAHSRHTAGTTLKVCIPSGRRRHTNALCVHF